MIQLSIKVDRHWMLLCSELFVIFSQRSLCSRYWCNVMDWLEGWCNYITGIRYVLPPLCVVRLIQVQVWYQIRSRLIIISINVLFSNFIVLEFVPSPGQSISKMAELFYVLVASRCRLWNLLVNVLYWWEIIFFVHHLTGEWGLCRWCLVVL